MESFISHGLEGRWLCYGCDGWTPFDITDILNRCGPRWVLWNELTICPCGAPRSLHYRPILGGTPYRPAKHEWLWIMRELTPDSDGWFTIEFMTAPPPRRG